jgi:hypothetical protein
MRKLALLCAGLLCLSGAVAAQNEPSTPHSSAPASGSPAGMTTASNPWQVAGNFAYQRFNIGNNNSNLYGFQSSVARYIGDSDFGIEGGASVTFGYLSPHVREQMIFYGGGLHIGKRHGFIQPWAHILVGGAHIRTSQGIGSPNFNGFALEPGAGVDFAFRYHFAFRVEGDYIGSHIGGVWQPTAAAGAGFVVNF